MYRIGDRKQMELLPRAIEDYVKEDDGVRVYDAFIEGMDMWEIGIKIDDKKVGNSEYDPRVMLKLLVYGYSCGVRSSRKLEKAVNRDMSFIWLCGGLKPDHKTISDFRKNNEEGLKKVLKEVVRISVKMGMIEGNTLFIDGSKIRGNCGIGRSRSRKEIERELKEVDKRIDEIMKEVEEADEEDSQRESLIRVKGIKSKEDIKKRLEEALKEIKREERDSINMTDKDSIKFSSRQGSHSGYNAQVVIDDKNGLIANAQAVKESSDINQLSKQIGVAQKNIGKKCEAVCADAGYNNGKYVKELVREGIRVIVPNQRQIKAERRGVGEFDKSKFKYDEKKDVYICPQGEELENRYKIKEDRLYKGKKCMKCERLGECTSSKKGRSVRRMKYEKEVEKSEQEYASKEGQEIYRRRKCRCEHPFGHIKRNLGVGAFMLRGIAGVNAELSILTSCFNIRRLMTIVGNKGLIAKLAA